MGVLGPTRKDGLPPYYDSKVPPEKTQGDITKLLYQYGATGTQWAEIRDEPDLPPYELQFIFPITGEDGIVRKLKFRVRPPMLRYKNGDPHPTMTMRLLFHWLKAKLEATAYGLQSFVEEFLPQVVAHIAGPDGEPVEVTVAEVFVPQIEAGQALTPGGMEAKALSSGKEEE